jgi:hypothetical protein
MNCAGENGLRPYSSWANWVVHWRQEKTMDRDFKRLTDFLLGLGVEKVEHTGKNYLAHVIGVCRLMQTQGCTEELCRAGMFHSVYGTERFQGFKLPLERRGEIAALIGERAEQLAYLNCAMDRASLDARLDDDTETCTIRNRITGDEVRLSRRDFDDLCRIHLFDWLEQVPRSRLGWGYRREAFRRMAERLGGTALATYDRTFAQEPATSGSA